MRKDKREEKQGAGTRKGPLIARDPGRSWTMFLLPDKAMTRSIPRVRTFFPIFPHFSLFPNIKVNFSAVISPHGFPVLPPVSMENPAFMA